MTELTILMPCLNEAETIEACILKAQGFLARTGIDGEVLISDNGSTDGSREIAERLGARVVLAPRRGNGIALSTGIAAAKGRYVIMGDSDDSYDFSRLDAFIEKLRGGADLVMGNRFLGGIEPGAMPFLHRYLGNPVLSFIGRTLYHAPVGDFQCGLRGFSRDAIIGLDLKTEQLEFCPEMVMRAALSGLKISEVPTTLKPDGRSRKPHLRTWYDGWRHLKLLLTFAPFGLFLYPGLALLVSGLVLFVPLMSGPRHLGGVTLGAGTLIFAASFLITGFQLVCCHALARLYAVRNNLLPSSPAFERLRQHLSVEMACKIGAVFLLLAVIATGGAVTGWVRAGLGPLEPFGITRSAALVAVLSSLGMQSVTFGFLWGLMSQSTRNPFESVRSQS